MTADRASGDHAADAFSPEQRAALRDAIAVHDEIDLAAVLPFPLHLDYDARLLERSYGLSRRLWEEIDRTVFVRLALRLSLGRRLTEADARAFKDIRARAKQVRFARTMLADDHGYPPLLDRVTRLMGQAQDAWRSRRRAKAALCGVRLRLRLTRSRSAALDRETRGFAATDPAAFRSYVLARIENIRETLREPAITDRAFHDTRKVIGGLVAFYDTLTVLAPSDDHRAVDRYLSTINGLMGRMHDAMAERKAGNRRDYEGVARALPEEIGKRLRRLVEAFQAPVPAPPSA